MLSTDLESVLGERPDLMPALCELVPAATAWFDAAGALRAHNGEFTRLVGKIPAGVQDCRFIPLPSRDGTAAPEPLVRALAGAHIAGEEFECGRPDGTARWVRLSATPLRGGGALVVLVDVGESRGLETVRQQALGVVAHDLRNPLSALRMTLSLMAKPTELPMPRRVQLAERMLGTISRTESIVSSLLEYARADAGVSIRLAREPVDLGQLYERVRKELQALFPNRQVEARLTGALDGRWDEPRIERVLGNLLSNAFKHGRDDVPVEVVLDGRARDAVRIEVRNQGAPIVPELLPKIFEPFTVGPLGQDGQRRSVGLGLYIVKYLVAAHGGSVQVRSNIEEGTTFTVLLPRDLDTAQPGPPAPLRRGPP